jgi:ATP-dependent Clp protease ATP-binding subunit ClpC
LARSAAALSDARAIDTGHILIGLLQEPSQDAFTVLAATGADADALRTRGEAASGRESQWAHLSDPALPYAEEAKRAILATAMEAHLDGREVAQPRHLLRALAVDSQCTAARLLVAAGVTPDALRQQR